MFSETHQATSKDWLKENEGIIFASRLQGDIGSLSMSGSPVDFTIVLDDISSYLSRNTLLRINKRTDDLKEDLIFWDTLSDEALRKFEADL